MADELEDILLLVNVSILAGEALLTRAADNDETEVGSKPHCRKRLRGCKPKKEDPYQLILISVGYDLATIRLTNTSIIKIKSTSKLLEF
jgi:hypothetical protein